MKITVAAALALLGVSLTTSGWAQEHSDSDSVGLFLNTDLLQDEDEGLVQDGQDQGFLQYDSPRIGGSFRGRFDSLWSWPDGSPVSSLTPDLGATFFLDARPRQDFRVFAKVEALYPFGDTDEGPPARVVELFSDVDFGPVFARVGKQTIRSGVGLYFSPADLLSLASIDPEDPSAEREGPTAVRLHLPLGTTNLSLYEVMNTLQTPDAIGTFARVETVVGGFELGVGGFSQKDRVPRLMATSTGALGPLGSFAELVVSRGSDRRFLQADGVTVTKHSREVFVDATLGLSYNDPDAHWSLGGQYYYNGDGYEDSALLPQARALAASPGSPLSSSDLEFWGRHFAAVGWSAWDLNGSGFAASLLWISNLSDRSGRVVPQISYRWDEALTVALGVPTVYGSPGSDYAPRGNATSVTLSVSLGSGSF